MIDRILNSDMYYRILGWMLTIAYLAGYVTLLIVLVVKCTPIADARGHWPPVVPPPLMEAFVIAGMITNLDPNLIAAWSYTETEWDPYVDGSPGSTEKGLFHMRDGARMEVGCMDHDPYDRFQDAVCAAKYLELVKRRCGSLRRGISYVKTGYCYRVQKGSEAFRVLRIKAEIATHRTYMAYINYKQQTRH